MIGLSSFLLIGYWTTRTAATKSAIKAMLINRVSDTLLLISILCVWWFLGTTEYAVFSALGPDAWGVLAKTEGFHYIDWICLTMFIGCMGKSAQVFLHVWLADAMEACKNRVSISSWVFFYLPLFFGFFWLQFNWSYKASS